MNSKDQNQFVERINSIINARSLKKSNIIRNSGIDRIYGYQMLSGRRKPSRGNIIKLCLGMNLSASETINSLESTKYARLLKSDPKDTKIIESLKKKI